MLGRLRRVTSPRSSRTGLGKRMCGVSGMVHNSFCKPTMTTTRTASLCWMSSLTQFQHPLRMVSTAVLMSFLLALSPTDALKGVNERNGDISTTDRHLRHQVCLRAFRLGFLRITLQYSSRTSSSTSVGTLV